MTHHVPIGEVADWLHHHTGRRRALVLLQAYFDETGIHEGARVTAIAGFVGTKEAWASLEAEWISVLSEFSHLGVHTFHMTDCISQHGEFERVDRPGVNYIITQLSRALGQSGVSAISSAVVVEDWNQVIADEEFLRAFPAPFALCFDDLVRQLWEWAERNTGGELVAPMFAMQPEYHEWMAQVGAAYGAQEWYRRVLGPIAFGCPQQVVPLQSADMVVHQFGWEVERRRYGPIGLAEGSGRTVALDNATGGRFIHGHWFDHNALKLTVQRFRQSGEIYPLDLSGS